MARIAQEKMAQEKLYIHYKQNLYNHHYYNLTHYIGCLQEHRFELEFYSNLQNLLNLNNYHRHNQVDFYTYYTSLQFYYRHHGYQVNLN